jgi:hypothetical protein
MGETTLICGRNDFGFWAKRLWFVGETTAGFAYTHIHIVSGLRV